MYVYIYCIIKSLCILYVFFIILTIFFKLKFIFMGQDQNVILPKNNAIVAIKVINDAHGTNDALSIEYNGVLCDTPEKKVNALRTHYKMCILRKYGITPRDNDGEVIKNLLVVNGELCRPKLPPIKVDEQSGAAIENIEQYYNRTKLQGGAAYTTIFKGLERIDYLNEVF